MAVSKIELAIMPKPAGPMNMTTPARLMTRKATNKAAPVIKAASSNKIDVIRVASQPMF
ncbi:MAG: hypothetical protein VX780_02195 [Pseudomonadota bacterium]|nr:hypothetical protein [Pseudomonadota bacterium]